MPQTKATWEQDGEMVRRCSKCREVKPLEGGFFKDSYGKTPMKRWSYWCKTCATARITVRRRQVRQDSAEQRAREAAWKREWRKQNPERTRAAKKAWYERVMADPQRHAAMLEADRMAYRLRQEKLRGIHVDDLRKSPPKYGQPKYPAPYLPCAPLGDLLERMITEEERSVWGEAKGDSEGSPTNPDDTARGRICRLAGIPPRSLYGWTHDRKRVRFDVADRVLMNLGLDWWDVWDASDPAVVEAWTGEKTQEMAA